MGQKLGADSVGSKFLEALEEVKEIVREQKAAHLDVIKEVKEAARSAIKEELQKEESALPFSNATQSDMDTISAKIDILFTEGEACDIQPTSFEPFKWGDRSEYEETPLAKEHLEEYLKRQNPDMLGRGGYKLVDVRNTMMRVKAERIGHLKGKLDLAICPYKVPSENTMAQAVVLFELKKAESIEKKGFQFYAPQIYCELISARYLSHQPKVMLVLTDLNTGGISYVFDYQPDTGIFISKTPFNIDQLCPLVEKFLMSPDNAEPNELFNPGNDPTAVKGQGFIQFNKRFKTDFTKTVAFESFRDAMDDDEMTLRDRAGCVANFFQACGVQEIPSCVLHSMYA